MHTHLPVTFPKPPEATVYLKRKTTQLRSSRFILPDKGLQGRLGMYSCVTGHSRSTFQQPRYLLEPPSVLYATIKPCVQSAVLPHRSLKRCVKLQRQTGFLLQGLFSSAKDLRGDLNFIFFESFSKIFFFKVCWLVMWLLECFFFLWTKCCICRNASVTGQPMQPLPSPESSPGASPSIFAETSLPRAVFLHQ